MVACDGGRYLGARGSGSTPSAYRVGFCTRILYCSLLGVVGERQGDATERLTETAIHEAGKFNDMERSGWVYIERDYVPWTDYTM